MKDGTRSFYEVVVREAVARIASSLDDALDLAALSKKAALSPLHFHRIFRGLVGETPLEVHRRLRLERAAHRLATTDLAVTSLAFDAGYETHESFTRAFTAAFGVAPSVFRQSGREEGALCRPPQIELAARSGLHFRPSGVTEFHFTKGAHAMNVDIETLPAMRVGVVHHTGPYGRISEAFARLGEIAGVNGLFAHPGAKMLGVYHDDPESTPANELRSDAGIVVPDDVELPAGLDEVRLPAGRYAKTIHRGPYTGLGDAWSSFMGSWLPASGHRIGEGTPFEVYASPQATTPPADLVTELYLPLA
ncbi:MAG TPA: AraC family transcriptional regulator [Polyangiaceae bacterium]